MKRISVVTLGCKVNQYDTAALLNHLPSSRRRKPVGATAGFPLSRE